MRDPYDDFLDREYEHAKWLKTRPKCQYCGEPIQQERAVNIDGKWYCDHCLDTVFRESIPD